MLRIGVMKKDYYCEKRNVTDRVNGHGQRAVYRVVKPYDLAACLGLLLRKGLHLPFSREQNNRMQDYFHPIVPPPVDLLHTCNVVCETSRPWIATFEGAFPMGQYRDPSERHRQWMARNYRQLAAPSCKKILAFSHWAADCTLEWMRWNQCPDYDRIRSKLMVLYPPQAVQITEEELRQKFATVGQELRFVFVGRDFYRKGMYECLLELVRLHETVPMRLFLVSGLAQGYTYRVPCYSGAETAQVRELLQQNADWIEYHEQLPNDAVLQLCKKAHVGLLPTYRDSFGYSVIEMQSCGCTVLSTDIFALPELNDASIGYVCSIREAVDALSDAPEDAQALRPLLQAQLHEQLARLVSERDQLYEKACRAVRRVAERYDPDRHAEVLWNLYQECLNDEGSSRQCDRARL